MGCTIADYRTRFGNLKPGERTGEIRFLPEADDPEIAKSYKVEVIIGYILEDFVGFDTMVESTRLPARQSVISC